MTEHEPVMIWTTLGALIGAFLWRFMPDLGGDLINAVVDASVIIAPVLMGAWYARAQVTPVADPHDNDGTPLVRGE